MLAKSFLISASFAALALANVAKADAWTDADNLFKNRALTPAGLETVKQARNAYLAILNNATTTADKVRAVTQLGRLATFEGEMYYTKDQTDQRKAVFKACWDNDSGFVEKIKPAAIGGVEHPAYYYFKGACLAWWGEAAGTLASLPYVPLIKSMMEKGLTLDTRFESGGPHRLAAGILSNKKAQPLGLYKPEVALDHQQKALDSAVYPGDQHNGKAYMENWKGKAQVLVELNKVADAKAVYQSCIDQIQDMIDNDELPAGREQETLWTQGRCEAEKGEL